MGYEVELTPESRDGGRDILTVLKIPAGEVLTVVECKRYGKDKRVGIDLIQRLLWVAAENDRASRAMLVTSAYFTKGAWNIQRNYRWKLSLADFDELNNWLSQFGSWESTKNTGLWIPK